MEPLVGRRGNAPRFPAHRAGYRGPGRVISAPGPSDRVLTPDRVALQLTDQGEGQVLRRRWCAAQHHAGFHWRFAALLVVAALAGRHAVLPARHAAARPRKDVVERQVLASWHRATILAGVAVADEDTAA